MNRLNRSKKHKTIRKYLVGSATRPRLSVYRSTQHIYAQIIDDSKSVTIVSESDTKVTKGTNGAKSTKSQRAYEVGKKLAEKAVKTGVKEVVFDRGGFLYHGRIKSLADGAREGGLKF